MTLQYVSASDAYPGGPEKATEAEAYVQQTFVELYLCVYEVIW